MPLTPVTTRCHGEVKQLGDWMTGVKLMAHVQPLHRRGVNPSVLRSSDDEETEYLRQFVLDYIDGKVVCSEKTDRASLRVTFPLLRYAVEEPTIPEDVGLVWTHASLMEGWRYPNGYPYFTLNYLTKAQAERVRKAIAAETERRKAIEV